MIIAQISDMHIKLPSDLGGDLPFANIDTGALLRDCVDHIRALNPRPDIVIATGDLTDKGSAEEYAYLRELLTPLECPVFLIPGNHDGRNALWEIFADEGYFPKPASGNSDCLNYIVEDYPLRLIALDTLVPNEPGGWLEDAQIAWLDERLGESPSRPTVILMHHPPYVSGIAHMDAMMCGNCDALGAVVARHPQVERIICGHLHRPVHLRWHGTVVCTAPSPGFQVVLNLEHESAAEWVGEPPAYCLHLWRPETGLVTHISYIGDYGGPQPFPWA
jgi:3',5'-cyclic AMP phosphodiesterase CpdA